MEASFSWFPLSRTVSLVFDTLFVLFPQGYQLVVTGHSLGAGAATLLSILLKPTYPELRCFAFSPPGGLLRFVFQFLGFAGLDTSELNAQFTEAEILKNIKKTLRTTSLQV